jgi:hypothetical protein
MIASLRFQLRDRLIKHYIATILWPEVYVITGLFFKKKPMDKCVVTFVQTCLPLSCIALLYLESVRVSFRPLISMQHAHYTGAAMQYPARDGDFS